LRRKRILATIDHVLVFVLLVFPESCVRTCWLAQFPDWVIPVCKCCENHSCHFHSFFLFDFQFNSLSSDLRNVSLTGPIPQLAHLTNLASLWVN